MKMIQVGHGPPVRVLEESDQVDGRALKRLIEKEPDINILTDALLAKLNRGSRGGQNTIRFGSDKKNYYETKETVYEYIGIIPLDNASLLFTGGYVNIWGQDTSVVSISLRFDYTLGNGDVVVSTTEIETPSDSEENVVALDSFSNLPGPSTKNVNLRVWMLKGAGGNKAARIGSITLLYQHR